MVHDVHLMQPTSCRMIVNAAACLSWQLFSHDVTREYCQLRMELTRKIYLRPWNEDRAINGIKKDEYLELLIPLYGVCNAGDYRGATSDRYLSEDLSIVPTNGDKEVYFWVEKDGKTVTGAIETVLDDSLNASTVAFQKHAELTLQQFDSKPRIFGTFDFTGLHIETKQDTLLIISQPCYT